MSESRSHAFDATSPQQGANVIEPLLVLVYRVLAWTFGIVGGLFFLFPDGTIDALNAVGRLLGFAPAPHLAHRFWLSLGVAYMAVVTSLAALIARGPVAHRILMLPLAIGKATSSLTCLWFFLLYDRYFIYLANFLVDASLALLAWATYVATAPTLPGTLPPRARRTLEAVAEALFPQEGVTSPRVRIQELADAVERQLAERGPLVIRAFSGLLTFVDWNPRLFHLRWQRLSELPWVERVSVLESMEQSRWLVRRQAAHTMKLLLGLHGYSQPALRVDLHVDDHWLASRLEQARARRERGEKGPYPIPAPVE